MSEKNAEVVRRGIDAFNRGEVEELLLYANPEIELNVTIDAAERNVYRGHEGVRTWFADTFATFEDIRTEVSELRDLGDRIVLLGRTRAQERDSGALRDSPAGWIFTLSGGTVMNAESFASRAETLEAAGLQD
jgi:ketosteroid isomerase-like protein